jgi:Family of unknown function (DUF6184)
MKSVALCTLAAVALVAVGACSRDRSRSSEGQSSTAKERLGAFPEREMRNPNDQDRAGTAFLTSASWVANDAAIERLVASRCAREVSCSNIGPDKHFTDGQTCTREVQKKTREALKASECPNGIDGKQLDQCLDAIRNESCSNPIDTLGRLAACRTSELCLRIELPHR